jgi:hypothetical protein
MALVPHFLAITRLARKSRPDLNRSRHHHFRWVLHELRFDLKEKRIVIWQTAGTPVNRRTSGFAPVRTEDE